MSRDPAHPGGSTGRRTATSAARGPGLRSTLVEVALAELERTGRPEAVTISAIVTGAGCTPPSLYHYWPSRQQLLLEAAALGWSRFQRSQAEAVHRSADPRERIRLRGKAYLTFSREHAPLFRVLFLGAPTQPPPTPPPDGLPPEQSTDAERRGPAFWALHEDVAAAVAAGQVDPGRLTTADLAMTLWCAVHGLATLALGAPTGGPADEQTLATLDEAVLGPDPRQEGSARGTDNPDDHEAE